MRIYLILSILGFILPYSFFVSWLLAHDFDLGLLWQEITGSRLALFAWADVIISAIALISYILVQHRKHGIAGSHYAIAATCLIGPSCGLPLFLYFKAKFSSSKQGRSS